MVNPFEWILAFNHYRGANGGEHQTSSADAGHVSQRISCGSTMAQQRLPSQVLSRLMPSHSFHSPSIDKLHSSEQICFAEYCRKDAAHLLHNADLNRAGK